MKKILAAAALMGSLIVAAPASAQGYGYGGGVDDFCRNAAGGRDWICTRQDQVWRDLVRGMRTGQLSPRESGRLRAEFGHIAARADHYRYNGFNRWERAELTQRLDRLSDLIRYERRDYNNYRG
jgi:hypothetical protein